MSSTMANKYILNLTASVIVLFLGAMVTMMYNATALQIESNKQFADLNVTMRFVREDISDVKINQAKLQSDVYSVKLRVGQIVTKQILFENKRILDCERMNVYWKNHQIKC